MNILVLVQTRSLREILSESLRDKQHEVESSSTREQGLDIMRDHSPDAVIWVPTEHSSSGRREIRKSIAPQTIQIVVTDDSDDISENQQQKVNEEHVFSRPVNLGRLHKTLLQEQGTPKEEEEKDDDEMIVRNDAMTLNAGMKEVFRRARKVASLDCNVLLVGDTGTGKELIAREIHRAGNKDEDQFYGVNCPGLNENLFEAELFGFREGSFTGANEDREGFFQKASGGTLLLDEIGSLDRGLQSKLLRVLEEETFYRVGDVEAIKETPRIIAATNKSPQTLIEDNSFRRDLYYRLNVVELRLPPLRNREEDILPLTNYFIKTYNGVYDRNVKGLTKPVNQCFRRYSWPGNVRELKNAIEGAVIFADGPLIEKTDLPSSVRGLSKETNPADATFSQLVREYKKEIIKSAISRAGGNRKEAAENLEIDRSTIYRNVDEESESK